MTITTKVAAAAVLAMAVAFGDADGTWVKRTGVGTGGTDWTSWNEPQNWQDGTVAFGATGVAELGAAAGQYIELPDSFMLKHNTMATTPSPNPVLRSDSRVTLCSTKAQRGPRQLFLYAPFAFSVNDDNYGGPNGFQICGPCESVTGTPLWFYVNSFRFDLYATAAGGARSINAWPTSGGSTIHCWGSPTLKFYAPHGSSASVTGNWQLMEGSRFLKRADGQQEHVLSVGTTVTGAGIPDGAWLKRVFPDGTIELSAAATTTAASVPLTFAALGVDVSASMPKLTAYAGGGETKLYVQKYRAEDAFTVNFGLLDGGGSTSYLARYRIMTDSGFVPGVAALSGVSKGKNSNVKITLENCHLKIAGDQFKDANFLVPDVAHTARVTVVSGESRFMGALSELTGTLIKDGEGALTVNLTNTASAYTGTLSIEAGTLSITNADAYVAALSIAAGATLDIPAGIHVGTLSVAPGAKIRGGKVLTDTAIDAAALQNVVLDGSCIIDAQTSTKPLSLALVSGTCTTRKCGADDAVTTFSADSLVRIDGCGLVDVLVVGGGGGGGTMWGGGGGGGGVIYRQRLYLTNGYYGVVVGQGGAGSRNRAQLNANGGDSAFYGLRAFGGGAGGTYFSAKDAAGNMRNGNNNSCLGVDGSSGGGGGTIYYATGSNRSKAGGHGIAGQGSDGGKSFNWCPADGRYVICGGGGGGAGAVGQDAGTNSLGRITGACGGAGVPCAITGEEVYYGGGGGGSSDWTIVGGSCQGGVGGGGKGAFAMRATSVAPGQKGTDGLGGGGGGGGALSIDDDPGEAGRGGDGGRGVVILRYARIKKGIVVSFR